MTGFSIQLLHEEKSVLCTVIELLNLLISLLRIENTGVGEHPAVVFGKDAIQLFAACDLGFLQSDVCLLK